MQFSDNIRLALNAIRSNWLRTVLTCFIIGFGIMALVGILTAVDAIKASLSSSFATMGSNNFDIIQRGTGIKIGRRGMRPDNYKAISYDQALEFKERFDYPAKVSVSMSCGGSTTIKYLSEKTNPNIMVRAGDENYLSIASIDLWAGRNFSENEIRTGRNVVLLGKKIADDLFHNASEAIDKIISVDNRHYLVVGILTSAGSTGLFSADDMALLPLTAGRKVYANPKTTYTLTVQVAGTYEIDLATAEAEGMMRQVRRLKAGEQPDFEIAKSDKIATLLLEQSSYVTTAATLIGIITLLGGAIGLMNIMLVSVAERIREIGICKALGANSRTILTQFLLEAIVICQIGGIWGIVMGILAGNAVSLILNGPFFIPWLWIIGGILICLIVGLVSGIYPALRAAAVDPIESLRHE